MVTTRGLRATARPVFVPPAPSARRWCRLRDVSRREDPPALRFTTGNEAPQDRRAVGQTCHRCIGLTLSDAVPDQDRRVIGDTELVDLIEVDAASAERPGEGPAVAVDNPLSATHAHSHVLTNSALSANSSP